jgi:hypothetical protein
MGTHCVLGVRLKDNSVVGCYVHFDGSTMKPRIESFIRKNTTTGLFTLIAEAQACGGIRGFHSPPWDSEDPDDAVTDFLSDGEGYAINEKNWHDDHFGARWWYLVDYETGEVSVEKTSCE